MFISEAFRYNGYGSISVSFLCNDIADDNQSDYQLAISNYALAIASAHSGDNWGAASHFARGHSHFGSIDWEKAEYEQNEPEDFVNHISLWHFEAEKTLAYCALGALFHSKDALIKEKMKKVAELYLHNYDHWSSL